MFSLKACTNITIPIKSAFEFIKTNASQSDCAKPSYIEVRR